MSTLLPIALLLVLGAPTPPDPGSFVAPPARPSRNVSPLGGTWPAHVSGKKVTVEAKTPNDALKQIAAAAGWGLALNTGRAGEAKVQFSFKKVGVEEAFAAVVSASNLQATRIGDSVAVTTPALAAHSDADDDADDGEAADDAEEARRDAEEAKQDAEEAQKDTTEAQQDVDQARQDAEAIVSDGGLSALFDGGLAAITKQSKKSHRHHKSNGNDHVQIGQDIDIPTGSKVGDVVAIGGSIHLNPGVSTGDVVAIGGSVDVEPGVQINGDTTAIGGSVHLGSGSVVSGDSVTLGGSTTLDPGAMIKGQQVNLGIGKAFSAGLPTAASGGGFSLLYLVSKLAQFVLFFCLGALLLMAAPTHLANIEALMARNPVRALLAGFLMTLAIPVLTILLIVTLVGIPLVAVEFFGLALAALMGFTSISVLIGRRLQVPVRGGGLLGLAAGTAIVVLITALPWVGWLAMITAWFVALGGALVTRFGSVPQA